VALACALLAGALLATSLSSSGAVAATTPTGTTGAPTTPTTPTTPPSSKADAASYRSARLDYRTYLSALIAAEPAGRQSADAFVAGVRTHCAGVLSSVAVPPSGQVSQTALSDLGEEIGADLALQFLAEAVGPFAQLSTQLGALTWSQPAPAQAVAGLLTAERDVLALSTTRLCADARALANHPLVAPNRTLSFLNTYLRASATLKKRLASFLTVLSSYATPSEEALISTIDRLVAQYAATSGAVERTGATSILSALGLTP
jgi:hypothetical protein